MLYHLLVSLVPQFSGFNVARYITFRTAAASMTALVISLVMGPWLIRRLRNDVDVTGAPGVEPWHDGLQLEATILIRELMTAQAISLVVIDPRIVSLPEIEQRARNWLALRGVDIAADHQPRSWHLQFEQ